MAQHRPLRLSNDLVREGEGSVIPWSERLNFLEKQAGSGPHFIKPQV